MINKETINFIESIIGVTGQLSESIQRTSNKRSELFQMRINDIIGTTGGDVPLYKRYTNNSDILAIKDDLEAIGQEVDSRGDAVIKQYYQGVMNDIQQTMDDNSKFQADKLLFSNPDPNKPGLEDEIKNKVDEYMRIQSSYGGATNEAKRQEYATDIQKLMIKYGEAKEGFLSYFGDRVTKDADLYNSISTVETYTKFILQEMLQPIDGGPGVIDEETHRMFSEGLFEGNMQALKRYNSKIETGRSASINTLIKEISEDFLLKSQTEAEMTLSGLDGTESGFYTWAKNTTGMNRSQVDGQSSEQFQIMETEYNEKVKNMRKQILGPVENRLQASDKNYKALTGLSYLANLTGNGTYSSSKQANLLPDNIIRKIQNAESNILLRKFGKNLDLNQASKAIMDAIERANAEGGAGSWMQNKDIVDALKYLETEYVAINNIISISQEAKDAGYKSIKDIPQYSRIDIKKISELIDYIPQL